jgi:hypothetical protein
MYQSCSFELTAGSTTQTNPDAKKLEMASP